MYIIPEILVKGIAYEFICEKQFHIFPSLAYASHPVSVEDISQGTSGQYPPHPPAGRIHNLTHL